MGEILFTASIFNFEKFWLFLPTGIFAIMIILIFVFNRKVWRQVFKGILKFFVIVQCLFLSTHFIVFFRQLVPFYLGHYQTITGNVENYCPPITPYNSWESFSIGNVAFEYGDYETSFAYHRTAMSGGIIHENLHNIRIDYVYSPLTEKNYIVRIIQLDAESGPDTPSGVPAESTHKHCPPDTTTSNHQSPLTLNVSHIRIC